METDFRPYSDKKPLLIKFQDVKEGTYIATFSADDEDLGASGVVSYAIISGNENGDLVLNSTSGVLTTFKNLDYERTPEYKVCVL